MVFREHPVFYRGINEVLNIKAAIVLSRLVDNNVAFYYNNELRKEFNVVVIRSVCLIYYIYIWNDMEMMEMIRHFLWEEV